MSDFAWLTLDEAAARLGIGRESVRRMARRKRWAKQPGNDGRPRIAVPVERVSRAPGSILGQDLGQLPGQAPGSTLGHGAEQSIGQDQARFATLEATIVGLTQVVAEANRRADAADRRAEELRTERDRWAAQAEQVVATVDPLKTTIEALKAALDAERGRLSEVRDERDRWRTAATTRRSWWPWRRSA